MAREKKKNTEVTNQFVVCGEVVDKLNYKEFNVGEENECWGFTLRIKTGENETHDVEYFTNIKSKANAGLETIYKDVKTMVKDGEGDIVRCVGKISNNFYYSKGERVNKIILNGSFCNRKKDDKKETNYEFGAIFRTVGYIDKKEVSDDKVYIEALVHEYKSKKGEIGCILPMEITDKKGMKIIDTNVYEKDVLPLSGFITKDIEVTYLDEADTEELSIDGAWGTELERIEKENERRKKLREEGIKKETLKLVLAGSRKAFTDEEIEDLELPFEDDDIEDMFDKIEEKIEKAKERDAKKNGNSDEDQPF